MRDDAWFERLYARHERAVSAYCVRRVGVADGADACAQVFAVAWRRARDVPDDERALPWLYGVARRVVAHEWRGKGRARRLAEKARGQRIVPAPGPEVAAVTSSEHALVREAVMQLPEMDREVLMLSAWEGLSHAEIAQALGCSRAAVDKRAARAKSRLARQYELLAGTDSGTPGDDSSGSRSPVRARKAGRDA